MYLRLTPQISIIDIWGLKYLKHLSKTRKSILPSALIADTPPSSCFFIAFAPNCQDGWE